MISRSTRTTLAERGSRKAQATRASAPTRVASEMSNDAAPVRNAESLELSVSELLRRARPLPPLEEMVIDDLTDDEAAAFLATLRS